MEEEENKENEQNNTGTIEILKTIGLLNIAAEDQFKAIHINTKLLFFISTMATIAAINSMGGASVLYKGMIFMVVGLAGLLLSRRYI